MPLSAQMFSHLSNHGFLNHVQNFLCWMDRLDFKTLVLAFDPKIGHELKHHKHVTTVAWRNDHNANITSETVDFDTKDYNVLVNEKLAATLAIMQLGYDIVFADADVIIIQDPLPYLLWPHVDYVHSANQLCGSSPFDYHRDEGNTGFYFSRSNERNIKLWQDTINSTLLSGRTADIGDQEIFWEEVRKDKYHIVQSFPSCTKMDNVDPQNWVACALDKCRFTAGMLVSNVTHGGLEPALKDAYSKAGGMVLPDLAVALRPGWNVSSNASAMHNPLKPVTEHANWIKGNKRKELLMRAYGYWIMPDTTPPILPDHP